MILRSNKFRECLDSPLILLPSLEAFAHGCQILGHSCPMRSIFFICEEASHLAPVSICRRVLPINLHVY